MNRQEKLEFIASQLQQWLNFHEQDIKQSDIQLSDSLRFRTLPDWISRGTLKEWIAVLKDENRTGNKAA